MYRFYIAFEGKKIEQIYDSKLKTITWTKIVKRAYDIESSILDEKITGGWKPLGIELLDSLGGMVIMADIPTKGGDIYNDDELKALALKDPDDWTYMDEGFIIRTRK